jgi:hypothetical protein
MVRWLVNNDLERSGGGQIQVVHGHLSGGSKNRLSQDNQCLSRDSNTARPGACTNLKKSLTNVSRHWNSIWDKTGCLQRGFRFSNCVKINVNKCTKCLTSLQFSAVITCLATYTNRASCYKRYRLLFVFGRCPVRILAGTRSILIKVFCDFPHSFQENFVTVS